MSSEEPFLVVGDPRADGIVVVCDHASNRVPAEVDLGIPAGLLDAHCCHRGTSLEYGRVERDGIRCCYHGWLFDVEGRCLEQPCEPADSTYKDRVFQPGYPCREYGGLVFAYMGPPDREPVLPHYDLVESGDGVVIADGTSYGLGGGEILDWLGYLRAGGWDVAVDCALIGVFGGLFIVPLYALVLQRSTETHRARIIACNNILNAGFMVLAAVLAVVWLEVLGLTIPQLFILAALLNAAVAIYIYTLVPEFLMRFLTWVLVNIMYRVKVQGLEHIPERGPALIVCNHVSFMDPLVIGGNVRRPVRFVMDHNIFRIPVLNFIFRTANAIPIAPAKEDEQVLQHAFERIDAELADGQIVCIFPEGKLTKDGEMNEFKRGVEKILERRAVPVVPMALRGLWGSFFSRREGKAPMTKLPSRFWSRIEMVVTAAVHGTEASATGLQKIVSGLRGEWQ